MIPERELTAKELARLAAHLDEVAHRWEPAAKLARSRGICRAEVQRLIDGGVVPYIILPPAVGAAPVPHVQRAAFDRAIENRLVIQAYGLPQLLAG